MKIIIPGIPIAKARPRFSAGKAYNCQSTEQKSIKWLIFSKMRNENLLEPLEGSISVNLTFYMPIPQSFNRAQINHILWGLLKHDRKPDIDNLEKWILDCCNEIIWKDDCQVIELHSKKIYCTNPRTEIEIMVKKNDVSNTYKLVTKYISPEMFDEFMGDIVRFYENDALSYINEGPAEDLQGVCDQILSFAERWAEILTKIKAKK